MERSVLIPTQLTPYSVLASPANQDQRSNTPEAGTGVCTEYRAQSTGVGRSMSLPPCVGGRRLVVQYTVCPGRSPSHALLGSTRKEEKNELHNLVAARSGLGDSDVSFPAHRCDNTTRVMQPQISLQATEYGRLRLGVV